MKNELIKAVLENDEDSFLSILGTKDLSVINYQDNAGFSALHYAVLENKYDFVVALLNAGADFELKDKYGNTALIRAVSSFRGDGRIIELLLAKGADRNIKNNYSKSAFEWAKDVANYDIVKFFN